MNKYKYLFAIPATITALAVIVVLYKQPSPTKNSPSDKVNIVASFYPLAYFAQNIGGEYVNVVNITPPGAEPHEFEPTPRDIAKIYEARLFLLNGHGVDVWGEKITPELQTKNVTVVKMSDYLEELKNTDPDSEDLQYDPHFWLDPTNAAKEADIIADALIKIDSTHAKEYNQNRDAFKKQLLQLDQEIQSGLASCKSREIITTHDAFGYLANRYNLTTFHILGLSPEEESSPKQIAAVANLAREKNIKYIFFETAVDYKLSQTIANEIGAQTLVLNPIESLPKEDIQNGQDYISIMRNNLQNLKNALLCP